MMTSGYSDLHTVWFHSTNCSVFLIQPQILSIVHAFGCMPIETTKNLVPLEALESSSQVFQTCANPSQLQRHMAGAVGFEPTTFGFGDRRSTN